MSGSYLGKDLNILPFLLKQYKVDKNEYSHMLYLIQFIDSCVSKRIREKSEQVRKVEEAKSKWHKG